jgi:hypothetical protein
MYDYLVDHAIKNVWCNPEQDRQYIFKPKRITPPSGALNYYKVMWRSYALPEKGVNYHIFQIGNLHPLFINLFNTADTTINSTWVPLSEACNTNKMLVNIYNDAGVSIPLHTVFYMFDNTNNLIIGIRENSLIPVDFSNDSFYMRVYSNAYFNSIRSDAVVDGVYVVGGTFSTVNDIVTFQNAYNAYLAKDGLVTAYVNGLLVANISLTTVAIGDVAEFIYDSSVIKTIVFKLNNLDTFQSTLDSSMKYILHYSDTDISDILYFDDNDIFLTYSDSGNLFKGLYYHKNQVSSVRMLTHRDYSISVPNVVYFSNELAAIKNVTPVDPTLISIVLVVRKSGYDRSLIYDNNRIFELYKLNDEQIIQAMTGLNSNNIYWSADNLESSAYTKIMRDEYRDITKQDVQDAYGYNSVSKLLADTPSVPVMISSLPAVNLPYGLINKSTGYEYDAEGKLLEYHPHTYGSVYNVTNPTTALVEMITGTGDYYPDVVFGTDNIPLPTDFDYRVYKSHLTVDNVSDNIWTDITGTGEYTVVGNKLVWANQDFNQFLMVRTNSKFLAYDLDIFLLDGNFKFTLSEMEDRGTGFQNYIMPVPMGELDLFMNGYSLINGLDYIFNFPEITILNKRFLIDQANSAQHFHIRFSNFCNQDLLINSASDYGYVIDGLLSVNNRFDLRDDKVLRIVVNGTLQTKTSFNFGENTSGVNITDVNNGSPYSIRDIVVPVNNLVNDNTYTYRAKSLAVDKVVSDYMTFYYQAPTISTPSAIPSRYEIVSPFIAGVIDALVNQEIPDSAISKTLSDNAVIKICKPYEDWLKFDTITDINKVDSNYVIVHPTVFQTTIGLNLYQYRFLTKVVKIYSKDTVSLSPFVILNNV